MSEQRVWIAQCLCPQRHCILAGSGIASDAAEAARLVEVPLRRDLERMTGPGGGVNPWCGLCHAKADTWRYELGRTAYRTMAEAVPALLRAEAEQLLVSAMFETPINQRPS
jgi:hypothetical protein